MKVILTEDVKKLGKKGEVVEVSDGYARNYVLPKKLGVEANGKNMNDLKLKKANEEKIAQEQLEAAKDFAKVLETKCSCPLNPEKAERPLAPYLPKRLRKRRRLSTGWKLIRRKSRCRRRLRAWACIR